MSNFADISFLSLRQQIRLIQTKKISSVELCKFYLEKIYQVNKQYNCFIAINDKES